MQQVKVYKKQSEFQSDSAKMLRDGWRIDSIMQGNDRVTMTRAATLGFLALAAKKKGKITVVYER